MLAITLFNFPSLESCLLAGETQIKLVFTYVSNNCNQIFEHTTFFETNIQYSLVCLFRANSNGIVCMWLCLQLLVSEGTSWSRSYGDWVYTNLCKIYRSNLYWRVTLITVHFCIYSLRWEMTGLKIPKRSFKQKKWQCNAQNTIKKF